MGKRLFVVSDIHGHYRELMQALAGVGFDCENGEHIFVSCGDLFDRGTENVQVYDFVKGLPRKILIRGNHDEMLYQSLRDGCLTEDALENGTGATVRQLLGEDALNGAGEIDTVSYRARIDEILAFCDSMRHYYETEEYVFTHGWLPVIFEGRVPRIDPNWRKASEEAWDTARWLGWHELYDVGATVAEKTIVCGHRPSWLGYMFDDMRDHNCYEIFRGEGLVAIDAGTVRSGAVNVLVVDEHTC